jgi:hypothetical protein
MSGTKNRVGIAVVATNASGTRDAVKRDFGDYIADRCDAKIRRMRGSDLRDIRGPLHRIT